MPACPAICSIRPVSVFAARWAADVAATASPAGPRAAVLASPAVAAPGAPPRTEAFSSPAIVRASIRRLNSSGSVPTGADGPSSSGRRQSRRRTEPGAAADWMDAKVKKRATAGQAMTARTRISMPVSRTRCRWISR